MSIDSYLNWYLAGTLPPSPAVAAALAGTMLATVPNTPDSDSQGSPRMVPGLSPWLYKLRHGGTAKLPLQRWTAQERIWRGLPDGAVSGLPCHQVIQDGSGAWVADAKQPLLNTAGNPIPVSRWDAQHLSIAHHVAATLVTGEPLGINQALTILDEVIWQHDWTKEQNPRALGWALEGAALLYPSWQAGALDLLAVVSKRVENTMGMENGVPFLVLNEASAQQADHGYKRICFWMQSRITRGAALWLTMPSFKPTQRLWDIYHQGLAVLDHGMKGGEQMTGLPGNIADDGDTDGSFRMAKPGPADSPLACWCWPAAVSATRLSKDFWDGHNWLMRIGQAWQRRDSMVAGKPGVAGFADTKNAGIALAVSGTFGWRA